MEFARRRAACRSTGRPWCPRGRPPEGGGRARCPTRRRRALSAAATRARASTTGRQTEDYHPSIPEARGLVREPVRRGRARRRDGHRRRSGDSDVGSVPLYLLEVDWLTDALYGGDREHRIRQELLLGIGGVRALAGARARTHRLPHERGPLGVPRARARTRARRSGRGAGATRSRRCAARPSSRRTRPYRPATRSSRRG